MLFRSEPTKALDGIWKNKIGNYLKKQQENGATIILVSHDIEFCSQYATYACMMFDGAMTASGAVREIFAGNRFYSTTMNKIANGYQSDVMTVEEVYHLWKERCQ